MVTRASVVAAALASVLITCAADLDLDHTEHHSQTIELDTPQARTDTTLPAEFSGRAKESAINAVASAFLFLLPFLSSHSHYFSLSQVMYGTHSSTSPAACSLSD